MGFGSSPYGTGANGLPFLDVPAPVVTSLVSSQFIDGSTLDYSVLPDGNYPAMDDTMQCVLMLLNFGVKRTKLIGPDYEALIRGQIKLALQKLTRSTPPRISIDSIVIETDRDESFVHIKYTNLVSKTQTTVQL